MDKKETPSSLFVNDGSFMERFKQLQQQKGNDKGKEQDKAAVDMSKPKLVISGASAPKPTLEFKTKTPQSSSGGKLAFSLKQKSKIVVPTVKLGADEDEEEEEEVEPNALDNAPVKRLRLDQPASFPQSTRRGDVAAPSPPGDPSVKKCADKLASFVAKNGRQFEDVTRQKNPGDSPFKFLFDESCADFKYYAYRLAEEEKALSQSKDAQTTPSGESSASTAQDPIAMMEFYMKKAAQEERRRQPKQSKDEMPPPASLQGGGPPAKGHHMGDYIPQEELEKFLATCNDAAARKAVMESAERARIQSDNVGHKLLSKMGWKEGEGLGSSRRGIADPIMAGDVKKDHLGVGAQQPGEVTPEDDIYEQYKKRMMLGYKHRPNPLNNPRKSYY
ncbi:hypothetical protein ACFE04_002896 [Oxalis oulophora]